VDEGGGVWIAAALGIWVRPPGAHFFERIYDLPPGNPLSVGGLGHGRAVVGFLGAPPLVIEAMGDTPPTWFALDLPALVSAVEVVERDGVRLAVLALPGSIAVLDVEGAIVGQRSTPPPQQDVWDLAIDDDGDVWMGDAHRLMRLQGPIDQSLAGRIDPILDLVPDEDDNVVAVEICGASLWASTLGKGLRQLTLEGDDVRTHTRDTILPQDHVTALACDRDGSLWIGTSWGGLVRLLPDGELRYHTSASGLPGDAIRRILVVPDGEGGRTLWFATEAGAASYGGE
jgi:hypothetical protein